MAVTAWRSAVGLSWYCDPPRSAVTKAVCSRAIPGVAGNEVRIPRGTQLGFRLERPFDVGVNDRGVMRNGQHYHDYYGHGSSDRRY